jgi:hypothetical protein
MNKLLLKVVMVVTVGSLLYSTPAGHAGESYDK